MCSALSSDCAHSGRFDDELWRDAEDFFKEDGALPEGPFFQVGIHIGFRSDQEPVVLNFYLDRRKFLFLGFIQGICQTENGREF